MNSKRFVYGISTALTVALVLCFVQFGHSFQCFGIDSQETDVVCSGNGICTSQDSCSCFTAYSGSNCSTLGCGWQQESLGSPQPTVTVSVDDHHHVVITVEMARRHLVNHTTSLNEFTECAVMSDNVDDESVFRWEVVEETTCVTTYKLNQTLQDFLSDDKVQKIFHEGDIFEARASVFTSYMDFNGPQAGSSSQCSITTFRTDFSIQIFLQGVSMATFEGTNQAIGSLRQGRIRVMGNGTLDLQATLTLHTLGRLSQFEFVSSNPNQDIQLLIQGTEQGSNCGSNQDNMCSYSLNIQSTSAFADYSGTFKFQALLERDDPPQSVPVEITFHLQYASPLPPSVSNVTLNTVINLYNENYESKKSVFTALEKCYALVSIKEKITVPSRKLTVRNAFLCCMNNRQAMPAYNPSEGLMGCTEQSEDMSFWAHLVQDEVPLTAQWDTQIQPLTFLDDKAGFSFSLLPLVNDNHLCYLHVESFLKEKTRHVAMSKQQVGSNLVAFSPLQVIPSTNPHNRDEKKESSASRTFSLFLPSSNIFFLTIIITLYFLFNQ